MEKRTDVIAMREFDLKELEREIKEKKNEVDRMILENRPAGRILRRRSRAPEEHKILDQLCRAKWKKAEQDGKVRYISEREWCYEFD
jgi:hypothetical protein